MIPAKRGCEPVAQRIEQRLSKSYDAGSTPARLANLARGPLRRSDE